ncbi:response regulator transcription factor [Paenibacillus radicis (ex Xue et al. 2023)]|uniref:Response regulator n=1 Tax=Paenibacillus radicis (ex Xue et al. 2023) TaxID=2972489 RepID=A0ABT1YPI8_9BACL|nr:response regulator [Paenibacillus radicis (ex Xue et al. 2023)]MCR8635089.1 response regulator [Paenibacillus radicis (ex Xue et al. 2023)]
MRLLIVDDEPVIRSGLMMMAQSYEPKFQQIETAVNGVDALERIIQFEPDLLLTDIRMPKMDGLELCRKVYENYPHILMVVVSGYSDFDYAQKCLSYGVKHYLLKPVTPPDLHDVFNIIRKSQSQGYIPVSLYVEWVERIEHSIWSLQEDEMAKIMVEWREHCSHLSAPQLKDQLQDAAVLLQKQFQEKNRPLNIDLAEGFKASGKADLFKEFEERLQTVLTDIMAVRRGNYKDPMEEAKAYIDNNLSVDISLKEVADMIGITPNYFSTLFKKMSSETFVSYRINKRMDKARELLAIPHKRTVDIAAEVGYDDYPHFTKTFKKIFGISPSEYRASLGIK